MASLAQQESESLSKNVKLGVQFRFQQGKIQVNHNRFLGYTKDEEGNLVINPEQAKVVKRIFREYLEGSTLKIIADGLIADGILTAAGRTKWRGEAVRKILRNEKYMGDALLQKTYTVDVLSKKRVNNNGIVPQYYVENSHEAIIPRELFMQVQNELNRRSNLRKGKNKAGKKRVYSGQYALSNVLVCSECGDLYRRVAWNTKSSTSAKWRCATRITDGPKACTGESLEESEIQNAVLRALNQTFAGKNNVKEVLKKNVSELAKKDNSKQMSLVDEKINELQMKLVSSVQNNESYDEIVYQLEDLRDKRNELQINESLVDTSKRRIEDLMRFIDSSSSRIEEYDDKLMNRFISKIVVKDEFFEFTFKSGFTMELKRG